MKYIILIVGFLLIATGCSSKKIYFNTDSSDKILHKSIVVINSTYFGKDIYFYAYKNRLYANIALDNEDDKNAQFRASMSNGKVNEDNPYIGMYATIKHKLQINLPELRIDDSYMGSIGKKDIKRDLYIEKLTKIRENLYEGCIQLYNHKLPCAENKVYIIKKPERCYYQNYKLTCLNQEHIDLYQKNKEVLRKFLNLQSINNKPYNQNLTQIYR